MEVAPPPSHADACVGPGSERAGKASSCEGCPNQSTCASGAPPAPTEDEIKIMACMGRVRHRVLVLSGKGGVGKSTFSAQLAYGLARRGLRVGLLDVDICGPSIPTMLGLRGREVHQSASGWSPVYVDVVPPSTSSSPSPSSPDDGELCVMSIGFLMPDQDAAVIWRGPRKTGLLTQFFGSVDWGELDYLVVDTPPGTSDEHISIVQLLKRCLNPAMDGAVVVTTPQEVAMADVRKELSFCKQTNIRVLGVVENMAPLTLPLERVSFVRSDTDQDVTHEFLRLVRERIPELSHVLAARVDVFPRQGGGPQAMADKFAVPFLGRVPLDRELQRACDEGTPLVDLARSTSYAPIQAVLSKIIEATEPGVEERARERRAREAAAAAGRVVVKTGKV